MTKTRGVRCTKTNYTNQKFCNIHTLRYSLVQEILFVSAEACCCGFVVTQTQKLSRHKPNEEQIVHIVRTPNRCNCLFELVICRSYVSTYLLPVCRLRYCSIAELTDHGLEPGSIAAGVYEINPGIWCTESSRCMISSKEMKVSKLLLVKVSCFVDLAYGKH